jgi:hypothetical protein
MNAAPETPAAGEPEKPGFYAVIPADVRYDKNLPQGAKLLYGEITALCNRKGFCWARNAYFANLYRKDERTVNRWLKALKDNGYIGVSFTFKPDSKEVDGRIISIRTRKAEPPAPPAVNGGNAPDIPDVPDGPDIPDGESREVVTKMSGGGDKNVRGVVTKMSGGGDKNVQDNNTCTNITKANILKAAAAAAAEKTTETKTKAAAAPNTQKPKEAEPRTPPEADPDIQKLKDALNAVHRELVFDKTFYPKALAFMAQNRLETGYLSWIYRQCLLKKPRILPGLFHTLFFADNMPKSFKISQAPPPPAPVAAIACPVCGTSPARNEDCPRCGLGPAVSKTETDNLKQVYALPEDRRKDFLAKEDAILFGDGGILRDFQQKNARLRALREEFGVAWKEDSS